MNEEQIKRFTEAAAMGNRALAMMRGEISVIENALALMSEICGEESLEGNTKILAVPWIGQNVREVLTDDFSNSDCGPACIAMWLASQGRDVTVDEVSKQTGLGTGYKYTLPANLIMAAGKFGLTLVRRFFADTSNEKIIARYKKEIDRGVPVIALVHYGALPKRYDPKFQAGHWIILTGYTDGEVVYNDPLWQDLTGHEVHLSWQEFLKAQDDCRLDGNTQYQGLVAM